MPWYFYGATGSPLLSLVVDNNPVGAIIPTTSAQVGATAALRAASAKEGYLFCNGAVMPMSTYPQLGALLGSLYGGDGVTTFGLPDLTSTFLMTAGVSYGPNTTGGALTHNHVTLNHQHNVTSHRHTIPTHAHSSTISHWHTVGDHSHTAPAASIGSAGVQVTIQYGSPGAAAAGPAHTHTLGGSTNTISGGVTGTVTKSLGGEVGVVYTTGYSGAFSSGSSGAGTTDSQTNLPSYIEQNFMIKCKAD